MDIFSLLLTIGFWLIVFAIAYWIVKRFIVSSFPTFASIIWTIYGVLALVVVFGIAGIIPLPAVKVFTLR